MPRSTSCTSGTTKEPLPEKHHEPSTAVLDEPSRPSAKQLWKFRMRPDADEEPQLVVRLNGYPAFGRSDRSLSKCHVHCRLGHVLEE